MCSSIGEPYSHRPVHISVLQTGALFVTDGCLVFRADFRTAGMRGVSLYSNFRQKCIISTHLALLPEAQ